MHIDENFAQTPILIFTCPQINLMPTNRSFLGIALAPVRQTLPLFIAYYTLYNLFNNLRCGCGSQFIDICVLIIDKSR